MNFVQNWLYRLTITLCNCIILLLNQTFFTIQRINSMRNNTIAVLESNCHFYDSIVNTLSQKFPSCNFKQIQNYSCDDFDYNSYNIIVFNESCYRKVLNNPCSYKIFKNAKQYSDIIQIDGNNHLILLFKKSKNFAEDSPKRDIDNVAESYLRDLFIKLGIRHNLTGCKYLKEAILLSAKDSSLLNKCITKKLYPLLAQKFNCNPGCIERAIRHALTVCFDSGKFKSQSHLFGNCFDTNHCPTNGEFIALVTDLVTDKLQLCN